MNNGTRIIFVLFYIFRHYKRVGTTFPKNKMISDLKKCHLILKRMEQNIDPNISAKLVGVLIDRINSLGANMKLQQPLTYSDIYDFDIVTMMSRITGEILDLARKPFYKRYSHEIFTRFLVLHNLPRALLNDSSGDISTVKKFHLSKQEALAYASMYIEDDQKMP